MGVGGAPRKQAGSGGGGGGAPARTRWLGAGDKGGHVRVLERALDVEPPLGVEVHQLDHHVDRLRWGVLHEYGHVLLSHLVGQGSD